MSIKYEVCKTPVPCIGPRIYQIGGNPFLSVKLFLRCQSVRESFAYLDYCTAPYIGEPVPQSAVNGTAKHPYFAGVVGMNPHDKAQQCGRVSLS